MRMRPRARIALFVAGLFALLALAVSAFLHPATTHADDGGYFDFCTNTLSQSPDVCCNNAGGVLSAGGSCLDSAVASPTPFPVPTVTQQVLPPVIIAPPA